MAEIYHVLNRGVDRMRIFKDDEDYARFVHDLFEFNDENVVVNNTYRFGIDQIEQRKPRKLLVNLMAFCLMPNHYHLLLQPRKENSMSLFMKKVNGGYANYFNNKHDRTGPLFDGRFKRVLLKDDSHFVHIPYYVHLNPLDLKMPEWRNRKIKNPKAALKFLNSYKWSSHLDYLGEKNFPSVTQRELLLEFFGGEKGYEKSLKNWLKKSNVLAGYNQY